MGGHVVEEIEVLVAQGTLKLSGIRFSPGGPNPVGITRRIFGWPGWLDNAGSMEAIAPYFTSSGFEFVVIDPPGCGHSDHRPPSSWYRDVDEIVMIMQAADSLEWFEPFILCGHSRGGNIASMCAGTFPNRIAALFTFDSAIGLSGTYVSNFLAPPTLDNCMRQDNRNRSRAPKEFNSIDEAIEHNMNNIAFPKSRVTAANIVKRHVVPYGNSGKLRFCHDTRTYGQLQPLHVVEDTNIAFLSSIQCQVKLLLANRGIVGNALANEGFEKFKTVSVLKHFVNIDGGEEALFQFYNAVQQRVKSIKHRDYVVVAGKHHFHSDVPKLASETVLPWLLQLTHDRENGNCLSFPPHATPPLRDPFESYWKTMEGNDEFLEHPFLDTETVGATTDYQTLGCKELVLTVRGIRIACKLWGNQEARQRIIVVPDVVDNASSFDTFIPALLANLGNDFCALAVDLPGRGKSDWLPMCEDYGMVEEAGWILWIAEAVQWTRFHLVGHGRGGEVSLMVAGSNADCTDSVLLLDTQVFRSTDDLCVPQNLYQHYLELKHLKHSSPVHFDSLKDAVQRNFQDLKFPKSWKSAKLLVGRSIVKTKDGKMKESTDPKLTKVRRVLEPARQRIIENLRRVKCPVMCVSPEFGSSSRADLGRALCGTVQKSFMNEVETSKRLLQEAMKVIPGHETGSVIQVSVPGYHHVHMDHPDSIVEPYTKFVSQLCIDKAGNPTAKL